MEMTLNNSGVRDIGRVLQISKDTKTNPYFLTNNEFDSFAQLEVEIRFSAEMDDFWSFVQNKCNQRWTWYAIERQSGIILAWHNAKRQNKNFLALWKLLNRYPIHKYHTDDWSSYSKYIPTNRHQIGKNRTWKIKQKNLRF